MERSQRNYGNHQSHYNVISPCPCWVMQEESEEKMKFKWINNGVTFNCDNYRPVIACFDNTKCWLSLAACTTTSGFRASVRELASAYGAKTIELKYFYDDSDNQTETNVVDFMKLYSEESDKCHYIFRNFRHFKACCHQLFFISFSCNL